MEAVVESSGDSGGTVVEEVVTEVEEDGMDGMDGAEEGEDGMEGEDAEAVGIGKVVVDDCEAWHGSLPDDVVVQHSCPSYQDS